MGLLLSTLIAGCGSVANKPTTGAGGTTGGAGTSGGGTGGIEGDGGIGGAPGDAATDQMMPPPSDGGDTTGGTGARWDINRWDNAQWN